MVRQFRRQYSDAPTTPPKKPGKFKRTLRWTWRLTYLSILGTVAYVSYEVWEDRHPEPQSTPDPSKKTLVILGKPGILHPRVLLLHACEGERERLV